MRTRAAALALIVGFTLACGGGAAPDAAPLSTEAAAAAAAAPAPTEWDGTTTFECTANDTKTIRGVTAKVADGPAVYAGGMCQLVIEDCDLSAGVAIAASGAAKVTVIRGRISGSEHAVTASGESVTRLEGVAVTGGLQKSGSAQVIEAAAAAAQAAAPAASVTVTAAPAAAPAAKPAPAAPAADSGAAAKEALKKKCNATFSSCKDKAYSANTSCRSDCVPSSGNVCDSACESCRSGCDSAYADKTSACERAWNSCY